MPLTPKQQSSIIADDLEIGDIFTLAGQYHKRTFWQWLTREPRQLERYTVVDTSIGSDITRTIEQFN